MDECRKIKVEDGVIRVVYLKSTWVNNMHRDLQKQDEIELIVLILCCFFLSDFIKYSV